MAAFCVGENYCGKYVYATAHVMMTFLALMMMWKLYLHTIINVLNYYFGKSEVNDI